MVYSLKRLLLVMPGFQWLCRTLTRRHVRTLMYHRFIGVDDLGERHITAEEFAQQLDFILRRQRIISSDDHLAWLRGERDLPPAPVVITVDDGYADFHDVAFPLFRDRGVPATLFATTGLVDGACWFWWDKLAYLLRHVPAERTRRRIGDADLALDFTNPDGRMRAWLEISDLFIAMRNAEKDEALEALASSFGIPLPQDAPPEYAGIRWEQVREMAAAGMVFGAHTATHPILARLEPAEARHEIEASRDRMIEMTGRAPTFFCFPQGGPNDFTPEVLQMVIEAGFDGNYVAYPDLGLARNPHCLPRYSAPLNWVQFRWIVCGAESLLLGFRRRYHRLLRSRALYFATWKPEWD